MATMQIIVCESIDFKSCDKPLLIALEGYFLTSNLFIKNKALKRMELVVKEMLKTILAFSKKK